MKINNIYYKNFLTSADAKKKIRKSTGLLAKSISKEEGKRFSDISIMYCDDTLIREYNRKYLNHDFPTDIITFYDLDEDGKIEGDLLISIDTVILNAKRFRKSFENELMRVIIHGLLHLCGYNDSTIQEKKYIRKKENYYLKYI